MNSSNNEFKGKNYIKINNTNLPDDAVARVISERFDLITWEIEKLKQSF